MKTILTLKSTSIRLSALSWVLLFFSFVHTGHAQVAASWTLSGNQFSDFGPSPFAATVVGPNILCSGLTRSFGLTTSGSGAFNAWGANGWLGGSDAASQVAQGKFVFFTLEASAGNTLSLSSINAYNIRRSGTGPTTGQWQYQVGAGAFVNLGAPISWGGNTSSGGNNQAAINLAGISALQNVAAGTVVTFRLANWGATSSTGTWYFNIQPLVIIGVAAPSGPTCTPPVISTNQVNITCLTPTGSATAIPSGGASPYAFLWNNGQQTATINGLGVGTYTVTVTTSDQCTGTASVTITSSGTPVIPVISDDTTICNGQSAVLVASGGSTYLWSPGGATTATITVNPVSTSTYTVTITNATSCSAIASVVVNVNEGPTVSIEGDTQICNGESTTLTASGGFTYFWVPGGETSADITVAPAESASYFVTVTNQNGCTNAASAFVIVQSGPAVSIEGDLEICAGTSTTLTASGGTSYLWSPGGEESSQIMVSPSETTLYTVTVTGENTCTSTGSVEVIVNEEVIPIISGNISICTGQSTTLTASGGVLYFWVPGSENTAAIAVSPITNTTYTVTVVNENSCSASTSVSVIVNSNPTANIEGDTEICNGESTTLTASGGSTYHWAPGNETSADITVSPIANAVYSVTVSDNNSCSASTSVQVVVNANPTASIIGDLDICLGESTTITAFGGTAYLWAPGGATTSAITVNPLINTSYTVTVTNANSCSATASALVVVNALPTASISGANSICSGSSTTLTAAGGGTYLWAPGGQTTAAITVSPLVQTTYTVTVTNANGCTKTATVIVFVTQLPAPLVSASGPLSFCFGSSVTLSSPIVAGFQYQWTNGNNDIPGATSASLVVAQSGTYRLRAMFNGCSSTSEPFVVNAVAPPVASIEGPTQTKVCEGSTYTFQATEGLGQLYQWYFNNAPIQGAMASSYTASVSGAYFVEVGNGLCSRISSVKYLQIYPAPTAVLLHDSITVCSGEPVVLFANVTNTDKLQWLRDGEEIPGENGIQLTTLSAGSYQVIVQSLIGCEGISNAVAVELIEIDIPVIQSSSKAICADNYVGLWIQDYPGYLIQWFRDGKLLIDASGSYYKTNIAGAYKVEITSPQGCRVESEAITVQNLAFAEVTLTADSIKTACEKVIINLKAVANGPGSIMWFFNGESVDAPVNNTLNNAPGGQYLVVYDNGCGPDSASIIVISEKSPKVQILSKGRPVFCDGDSIILEAAPFGVSGIQWHKDFQAIAGANSPTLTVYETGFYWITALFKGCPVQSGIFKVFVNELPDVFIEAEGDTQIPEGGSVVLSAQANAGFQYQWTLDGNPLVGAISNTWTASEEGEYVLQAIQNGCIGLSNAILVEIEGSKKDLHLRSDAVSDQFSIVAYPVPAGKSVTIRTNIMGLHKIEVLSIDGRKYFEQFFDLQADEETTLDLSSFPSGLYLVRVQIGKQLNHYMLPIQN